MSNPEVAEPETPLSPGRHSTNIDGVEQVYHVHGRGPICVVHPGGPGADWRYLRVPALEECLTGIYVEPIGTGSSGRMPRPADYTLDRYARHLQLLIDHLDSGPVPVLGHSHGGFVALTLAVEHPEKMAGLVLFDTAARAGQDWMNEVTAQVTRFAEAHSDRPELADILAALEEEATAVTDEELTSIFRRQLPIYFADYWSREREFHAVRDTATMYAGPNQSDAMMSYDVRDRLAAVDLPSIIIVGRHDVVLAPRWSEELHRALPRSELLILERSGHFGHLEEPERFATAVAQFVTQTLALT